MLPITRRLFTKKMFILPCVLMMACSEPKEPPNPTMIEKFELINGGLSAIFTFPVSYKAERATNNLLRFRVNYPKMEPLNSRIPQDDEISVSIEVFDRLGSAERMVAESFNQFDPERPGQEYHAGTEDSYELYRAFVGRGESRVEVTYYVFKAKDGSLVSVEDPGDWSVNYAVKRRINPDIHIKYLIAKPLGRDFIKIDEAVTNFIKQHLQTNSK